MSDYTKIDFNDRLYWEHQHNKPNEDSIIAIAMHWLTAFAVFIRALGEKYIGKIVVAGMSQGSDLNLHRAAYYPEFIDLSCLIAGGLSAPMKPVKITSNNFLIIIILGGLDATIVSAESACELNNWLKTQNYDVSLHEYAGVGHDMSLDIFSKICDEIKRL